MINTYTPKHNRKRKQPAAVITARCLLHGYINPRHSNESPHKKKRTRLLQKLCVFIAAMIVIDTLMISLHISTIKPYAITRDNKVICYVNSKTEAEKAIEDTAKSMVSDDITIVSVKSDLKISKAPLSKKKETVDNAAEIISEKAKEKKVSITANTIKKETFDAEPEAIIEKDDSMLAGQTEVVKEGTASKGEATYRQVVVNGEITDETKLSETIADKGTPSVIKKGTRGLPEGEDFKTYEGLPVCKDGKDIMATAASYIDKTPYVWGGKDLEKGVDCSGFVIAIYKLYGVDLGYPLEEEGVSVPYEEAKPGDILCFPDHFGLFLEDGKMIHASRPGTYVMESSIGNREILDVRRIITD